MIYLGSFFFEVRYFMRNMKLKKSLPLGTNGYMSRHIESKPEHQRLTADSKWSMRHKPYQNDYDSNLIRR